MNHFAPRMDVFAFHALWYAVTQGIAAMNILDCDDMKREAHRLKKLLTAEGHTPAGTMRSVLCRNISHVEVMQHTVVYRLTDGRKVEVYGTIGEAANQLLNDGRFARCHRSYIVNLDEVDSVIPFPKKSESRHLLPRLRALTYTARPRNPSS